MPEDGTDTARTQAWRAARQQEQKRMKLWTSICLVIAILVGVIVAWQHGGNVTSTLAWAGAVLGTGGLLGFLFGIPNRANRQININQPGVAAVNSNLKQASGVVIDPLPGGAPKPPDGNDTAPVAEAKSLSVENPAPLSQTETPADPPALPGTRAESNLEQVSDWVTKLLLGGGLTQLQQIPGKIWELARWVAVGMDPGASGALMEAHQSFACGLIIYFAILGFFSGYLITKIQLGDNFQF